jgi:flagellar motility protein MotE (MotC chaperone)
MSERRTPYQTLVRVRRLTRDARVRELRESTQVRRRAESAAVGVRERASREAGQLDRGQRAGEIAARTRASSIAVGLLYAEATRKQLLSQQLAAAESAAREALLLAEQSLQGAERIEQRHQQKERHARARAAQRRLDDRPHTLRLLARTSLLVLLVAGFLVAPEMHAEESRANGSVAGLLSEIRTRMTELDRREAELSERQNAIDELERAVEVRIRELNELSERVENQLSGWEEAQGAKSISRLAKIYGAMPAQDAADLIESLELDLATNVFAKMKPKKSAALLPLLSEERALLITRYVSHPLGIAQAPTAGEAR